MNATIIIRKGSDGTPRLTAQVGVGSKRHFMLMQHDYITLKFSTDTATLLHVGDYVDIENVGRYEITDPVKGEANKNTGGYDYDIRLDAQYWKFKNKLMKFLPQIGGKETSWTYTDTIANHAQQVLFNIRAQAYKRNDDATQTLISGRENYLYNGKTDGSGDWQVEFDDSVDRVKAVTIQYDSTNIIDAIADIAEAYECEWWFEQNVLHFGRCEQPTQPVTLEHGKEYVDIKRSDSKETYATRLFVYGGSRNIASNYRKDLIFEASIDREKLFDPNRPIEMGWFVDGALEQSTEDNISEYRTGGGVTSFGSDMYKTGVKKNESRWEYIAHTEKMMQAKAMAYRGRNYWVDFTKGGIVFTQKVSKTASWFGRIILTATFASGKTQQFEFVTPEMACSWDGQMRLSFSGYGFKTNEVPVSMSCVMQHVFVTSAPLDDITGNKAMHTGYDAWMEVSRAKIYKGTGLVIEVIDKKTGEVSETIENCIFNEAYDEENPKITLPAGKSIPSDTKYRLPQLNKALVPARYFTSIYTVFEKYQDITTNGIVNRRLLLPEHDEEGNPIKGYLDIFPFECEEEAVEDVVIFEDVYPSRISKITKLWRSDEYTDEEKEQDGSTTETTWRGYRYQDDLFNDSNPFDLLNYTEDGSGGDLKITFQSGLLNGMTFEVLYDTDGRFFEIKRDDTTKLPNETIKPKEGDEFILHGFNIAMLNDSRTDYVANAQYELLRKGREYAEKLNTDASTYQCTIGCDVAYEAEEAAPDNLYLGIGQKVLLIHPAYFANGRQSRVIGYEIPLDYAYDNPIYFIGEKAAYSRIGAIEDRLDGIGNTSGNFATALGGGSNGNGTNGGGKTYLIGRNDTTPPTDTNAYSALRARLEFAIKSMAQKITALWTFIKGIRIGNFIAGQNGAQIDEAGNAEVESIYVRSWMKVRELIYNRLNALEGNTSFADVGTIDGITIDSDGKTHAHIRMRWEGDFTAFQPGDVVYGYVNNLNNATEKEHCKAWAWVRSVDRAANTLELAAYPDSETPAGKNHPVAVGMIITRWGNNIEATVETFVNPEYSAVIAKRGEGKYINTRQSSFFISCEDGNIVELMGVNKPKLEAGNYGTILGKIPDGLLDEKTAELINKDQPYLFARGIIVQDLIRIGYEGVTTRTANYRGQWDAATAASATLYYRTTEGMYDTVTWKGALWQCLASQNPDEPSDANGAWLKMTASPDDADEVKIWMLTPNANIVSVRRTEVRPEILTCSVTLCSSTQATRTFESNYDLQQNGAKLFYSADGGLTFSEFIIGTQEPLDLEDESGVIELESSNAGSDYLTVGGNDIPTADIADRIIFELRDIDTGAILAKTHVPVVKDGERAPFQSTVFIRTNTEPDTPTGGTYDSPVPTSTPTWSDSIPEGEQMLWASTRIFDDKVATGWEQPRQMTDTATYDVEFSDIDQDPGTPSSKPALWFDPVKDKASKDFTKMLWRAERQKKNGTWGDWTIVRIKGEKGEDGEPGATGDWTSYVFKQSNTKPDTPTDTEHTIPSGWQDAPTGDGKWWMSKAVINGATQKPGTWSEPVQCTAEDGKPGQYTDFKYKSIQDNMSPIVVGRTDRHPNGWSDTPPILTSGFALWMIQAEIDHENKVIGEWSTPVRISGEKGDPGQDGQNGQDGKDGAPGVDGRDGLMVYPAGYYDPNTTYKADSETAPVVMYAENYYVLRRGTTYKGASQPENRNNPAKEVANALVANGESTSRWILFDKFNAIFADIIMADFAKLASAVFYGDWMISQQGTLTYTEEYRYKVASSAPSDYDIRADYPAGWSLTYPTSVPTGSSVYYIKALKSPNGALGYGQEWTPPVATTSKKYGDTIITPNSTKYQDFKNGSFEPNYSVNFRTGEMRAGTGVFYGAIRTSLKEAVDADLIDVGAATKNMYAQRRMRINKDLQIIVDYYSETELPTDKSYIGARVLICEPEGCHSRNLELATIVTQDGSYISGVAAQDDTTPDTSQKHSKTVKFANGAVEFLGVPFSEWNDNLKKSEVTKTRWIIVSAHAAFIYGLKD